MFFYPFYFYQLTLLKVTLNSAVSRISQKDDVMEIYEDKEKLRKVNEGYDWLAGEFPKEITVVDGEGSVEEVTKRLVAQIQNS